MTTTAVDELHEEMSTLVNKIVKGRERVCVFIDNSNLFHAVRMMNQETGKHKKLDYIKVKDFLADGRRTDVRFYYSDTEEEWEDEAKSQSRQKFYSFLENILGFTMIRLPLRERSAYNPAIAKMARHLRNAGKSDFEISSIAGESVSWLKRMEGQGNVATEKGLDCEIVYDMCRLARTGKYDTFILVAGDEDYARTVGKLRDEIGLNVEVAFFGNCSSTFLQKEATKFVDFTTSEIFQGERSEIAREELHASAV